MHEFDGAWHVKWAADAETQSPRPSWISAHVAPTAEGVEANDAEEVLPSITVDEPAPVSETIVVHECDAELEALRRENSVLRDLLGQMADSAAGARRAALEGAEDSVVLLAVTIAQRVVGAELKHDPAAIARWALEGIQALSAREEVTIVLTPDAANALAGFDWSLAIPFAHRIAVEDAAMRCHLRVGAASVELSASSRLAAIIDALEGEST